MAPLYSDDMDRRAHHQSTRAKAKKLREEAEDLFIKSDINTTDSEILRQALVKAKNALLLSPSDYETLDLIGNLYAEFDDAESIVRALEYYDRAIRLQPKMPEAYASKAGLLLYVLEKPEKAKPLVRTAIALSLRRRDPMELLELEYITLIDVLIARKRFAEARAIIRKALRKYPSKLMASTAEVSLRQIEDEENRSDL